MSLVTFPKIALIVAPQHEDFMKSSFSFTKLFNEYLPTYYSVTNRCCKKTINTKFPIQSTKPSTNMYNHLKNNLLKSSQVLDK